MTTRYVPTIVLLPEKWLTEMQPLIDQQADGMNQVAAHCPPVATMFSENGWTPQMWVLGKWLSNGALTQTDPAESS